MPDIINTKYEEIIMDMTLGPWTAEKNVTDSEREKLAQAMGEEAWKVSKKFPDFTFRKAEGMPAKAGFSISGKLMQVTRKGRTVDVVTKYMVWADGVFTNLAPVEGRASAQGGGMTAEDAVRATTESRVKQLLDAVKSGRIQKAR